MNLPEPVRIAVIAIIAIILAKKLLPMIPGAAPLAALI